MSDKNPSVSFCRYCGSKIPSNATFCSSCGKPLGNVNKPTNQVNAPTTQFQPTQPVQPIQPVQPNQTTVIVNQQGSNGIGTAGFILAILGLVLSWFPLANFVIWFLGFIFSFIGVFKAPRGLAVTGLILSLIDIIIVISIFGSIAAILSRFL